MMMIMELAIRTHTHTHTHTGMIEWFHQIIQCIGSVLCACMWVCVWVMSMLLLPSTPNAPALSNPKNDNDNDDDDIRDIYTNNTNKKTINWNELCIILYGYGIAKEREKESNIVSYKMAVILIKKKLTNCFSKQIVTNRMIRLLQLDVETNGSVHLCHSHLHDF